MVSKLWTFIIVIFVAYQSPFPDMARVELNAENKFLLSEQYALYSKVKSDFKEVEKKQECIRHRTISATEHSVENGSFNRCESHDNALSSSFENLYQFSNSDIKKNESFFYGIFNDNTSCTTQKKTVTIVEQNGQKFSPNKPIKKDKVIDGNKKIMEFNMKTESFLDLSSSNLNLLSKSISKLVYLTQLYIYDNKLSKIPKEIGNLVNLKELWMQENNVEYLPLEMKNCKLLEHFDIRHNHLNDDSLPVLTSFLNLKILLVTHNKFTRLDGIGRLKKLENLSVKSNKLEGTITRSLGELKNMVSLDLSKNKIITIPEEFGNCTKLKRLYLEFNKIKKLPEAIGNLTDLEFIGIKYNQLEHIPSSLCNCSLLRELNIESNLIQELPNDLILSFRQMIKLNISHNKFDSLPECSTDSFSVIEKINAEYNNISSLPGTLLNSKNLRILNLCYNNLSNLQSFDIQNLMTLLDLNMAFNHLVELPKDLCFLIHLESLDLTNNILSTTPKEIGQLKNLKFLNLESNILTRLPDEFGNLEKLRNLNISSNRLMVFPTCILKLKNLEMLNISENLISELPKSINELDQLTHLFLKDNVQLNSLPVNLASMKSLTFLSLNGCPLREIPTEYTKNPITVIAYLKAFEIGLRLQEYLKTSDEKLNENSIFLSDTTLNTTTTNQTTNNAKTTANEQSKLSKPTTKNKISIFGDSLKPRSLSVSAASKKDHIQRLKERKSTQKFNIPDYLFKKMKTTEAGFLACSRDITKK